MQIRIAIVGLGKIALDQHAPAIAADRDFTLMATVSPHHKTIGDVPTFRDLDALAASGIGIDAVVLCTPPQVRYSLAAAAIARGWNVFLEKPPGATLAEVAALENAARAAGVCLFASWHSRYAPGVEPARAWLDGRAIRAVTVTWREDVRLWHPGQDWIWEPGGLGVFDPGINALSIMTRILPRPFFIESATLDFPVNREAPIAARMTFRDTEGIVIRADFDWRQEGPQTWDILVETDSGVLSLSQGGAVLALPNGDELPPDRDLHGEYPGLYRRFAEIVRTGVSDVDISPLRHVADAFLRGRRQTVDAFED